jgi:hypothetical protein
MGSVRALRAAPLRRRMVAVLSAPPLPIRLSIK